MTYFYCSIISVTAVSGRVVTLSQHKFASNVVEKCVSNATSVERSLMIKEICQDDSDSVCSSLAVMIKDQYANYVVQKMIDTADDEDLSVLMSKIRSHISTLHKFAYGKHILAKLESYYGNCGNIIDTSVLYNQVYCIKSNKRME